MSCAPLILFSIGIELENPLCITIWIVELGSLLSSLSDLMLDWLHVSVYLPPHELRTVGRKHAEFFLCTLCTEPLGTLHVQFMPPYWVEISYTSTLATQSEHN